MQSALMVDPHPVTEEDQMCIGLALAEVGHVDENTLAHITVQSHYATSALSGYSCPVRGENYSTF